MVPTFSVERRWRLTRYFLDLTVKVKTESKKPRGRVLMV